MLKGQLIKHKEVEGLSSAGLGQTEEGVRRSAVYVETV